MTAHNEQKRPADAVPQPGADGTAAAPEIMDPNTDEILLEISLAAHEYGKSKMRHLSSLLHLPGPRLHISVPHASDRSSLEQYIDRGIERAYASRLFTRIHDPQAYVSPFVKDYARIVHSPSFRKLQGKSQLIPAGENYFFRTRLTHSLEVAEIAMRIARKLNEEYFTERPLDCDLIACACVLHDIGHPPFGHSGEEALNAKMAEHRSGFEGNAQTLRLVTRLENRLGRGGQVQDVDSDPRGLNLTVGTLASIIKYDKMFDGPRRDGKDRPLVDKAYYPEEAEVVRIVKERLHVAPDERLYTIECQIMDIADDIAYSAYDLEDTMEAGIVTPFDFISVDDATLERIRADVESQYRKRNSGNGIHVTPGDVLQELAKVFATILVYADQEHPYDMREWTHRAVFVGRSHFESAMHGRNQLIRRQFLETLIEGNIAAITVEVDRERPFMSRLRVNPDRLITIEVMKAFNYHKVISSRKFQIPRYRGRHVVEGLFDIFVQDTEGRLLSEQGRSRLEKFDSDSKERMRYIADMIAALTDQRGDAPVQPAERRAGFVAVRIRRVAVRIGGSGSPWISLGGGRRSVALPAVVFVGSRLPSPTRRNAGRIGAVRLRLDLRWRGWSARRGARKSADPSSPLGFCRAPVLPDPPGCARMKARSVRGGELFACGRELRGTGVIRFPLPGRTHGQADAQAREPRRGVVRDRRRAAPGRYRARPRHHRDGVVHGVSGLPLQEVRHAVRHLFRDLRMHAGLRLVAAGVLIGTARMPPHAASARRS